MFEKLLFELDVPCEYTWRELTGEWHNMYDGAFSPRHMDVWKRGYEAWKAGRNNHRSPLVFWTLEDTDSAERSGDE
jgi:hypothetical protein